MAHHKSAIKRIRQTRKRKIYNRAYRKQLREAIKAVRTATASDVALVALHKAYSVLDRVSAKGIVHKNTAANQKSALSAHVRKLAQA